MVITLLVLILRVFRKEILRLQEQHALHGGLFVRFRNSSFFIPHSRAKGQSGVNWVSLRTWRRVLWTHSTSLSPGLGVNNHTGVELIAEEGGKGRIKGPPRAPAQLLETLLPTVSETVGGGAYQAAFTLELGRLLDNCLTPWTLENRV